ncbi:MAG: ImmA/IrrE family metallo-endopeptidase [Desertifilum sp. SIO1I2]|nr:ImmA/IrrE family metallo-endopeptidase [Desertifilum sp. SIO1I2]
MSLIKPYRFYPKTEIERRANDLLMRMKLTPNWEPTWPFQSDRVADFLDLGVVWDRIPPDETGPIAARILPRDRQIEINEDILNLPQGFQESTIAHEIGHWMLHIDYAKIENEAIQAQLDSPEAIASELEFVCRPNSGLAQIESIEWQAQYFASCLLMPRHILVEKCRGRDLTRWAVLYAIREQLGVSISNLVNRLQDLGWIEIPKGSRKIQLGPVEVCEQSYLYG